MIGSQGRLELLDSETGVSDDSAHGERVDRIVPRNSNDSCAIGHHDVFALTSDAEASLFERLYCRKMVDSRYARQR